MYLKCFSWLLIALRGYTEVDVSKYNSEKNVLTLVTLREGLQDITNRDFYSPYTLSESALVGVATSLRAGRCRVQIPVRTSVSSLFPKDQVGSGAHPLSRVPGLLAGYKAAGA